MSMKSSRGAALKFVLAAMLLAAVWLASRFFVTIEAGHVGVITQFGKVTGTVLNPGLHWLVPWQNCEKFDCRVQQYNGKTECFSRDLQLIGVDISVLAMLPPDKAKDVYQSIGRKYVSQIVPRIYEILKQQVAMYNAESVIEKREEIKRNILGTCRDRLKDIVTIEDVVLVNMEFSDVYEKAIEQKQVAQQEALRAKYELERAKTDAEKTIEVARGEAEAIRVKGEALKDNPGAAQLEAIKKWNGVSPQTVVIGEGSNLPVVFPVK